MTNADPNPFAYCDLIVCYGGAKLTHKHLASKIHCVDNEIIAPLWIETSLRDLKVVASPKPIHITLVNLCAQKRSRQS